MRSTRTRQSPRLPCRDLSVMGSGGSGTACGGLSSTTSNATTDSLLHLLDGIHSKHVAERRRLTQVLANSSGALKTLDDAVRAAGDGFARPGYPSLRAFLELRGEPLYLRTAPGGPMEHIRIQGMAG